ncbi:UDP-N-acetylmuramate--L-alanine ligase [Collinsella sp. zg1085]|uniref:UDP-N-acetylmuramate--L-alanine ligase n=1 Tax=Collinsella sp. zg1085 TaxID=2844380 RepID=UPI001C0C4A50|nr:UDP-N-acetylmuramate--L-alanine ligase [Collinsella sp. zg1085]QWT18044.1 UDP-N-acetylmuramate--L-alanine ligase [Collinsella sp. zg1085]
MAIMPIPEQSEPSSFERVHFIGIGGAGMSGIALVLHERGYAVSGSDLKTSRYIRQLTHAGLPIHIGHEAPTIDEVHPDVVVVSTAIPDTNPELVRARELGIPVWPRAKMLSVLSQGSKTIAIAGTHGKTTTSSMCATMLDRMGNDPSFLIGGIVEGYDTNGRNGSSEYFVCEADESDSSFLYLDPDVVVITNVEADHLDHYSSLEEIEETFCTFMGLVGETGTVIVCGDDQRLRELAARTGRRVVSYGFAEDNDVVVHEHPHEGGLASYFEVVFDKDERYELSIKSNPGRHNMLNATASLVVASVLGVDVHAAAVALSSFDGVRRRFTQVGVVGGITVVDDYGHHPTEILATLKAAKRLPFEHVCVVFQPHRYSRLEALCDDFATSFIDADELILIDVFPAGEIPIPGVTSKMLADCVQALYPHKSVRYVAERGQLMQAIAEHTHAGDLLITMGAGDVTTVGPEFIEWLEELHGQGELR